MYFLPNWNINTLGLLTPKHFMALFQVSYANLLHDKAAYMQRKRACHGKLPQDVSELWANCTGDTTNAGYIGAVLASASPETQRRHWPLSLITRPCWNNPKNAPRENLNMKLQRILGLERQL